jgi:hypothetical protein
MILKISHHRALSHLWFLVLVSPFLVLWETALAMQTASVKLTHLRRSTIGKCIAYS